MNVLGIGEVVLDKICLLQNYPEEGEKVQPTKVEYSLGGPVTAALILLSKLGANCTFIASVGNDELAIKVKKKLSKYNITFIPVKQKATKMNTVLINSKSGKRTIIRDNIQHELIENISQRTIQSAELIIFDRHEPKAFDEVINKKKSGTKIIIDPSTEVSDKTIKMCQECDYPILPIESLIKFRRHEGIKKNLDELYNIVNKTVLITLGEKGSLIFDGQRIELLPAVDIKPVDTNGAGDIYRGAFGYGLMRHWGLKKCAEYANQVAALQCMKYGNGTAIPSKKEISNFRTNLKYKKVNIKEIIR